MPPTSMRCCARRSSACRSRRRSARSPPSPGGRGARSINARWRSRRRAPMTDDRRRPGPLPGPGPRPERRLAFRTGLSAERRAALLLVAKGFRILAQRWRSPVGEIDIVARRRGLLVFVEVKARENLDDAAAQAWLAQYPDPRLRDIRFDAMLVAPRKIPRHIPAAFDAGG